MNQIDSEETQQLLGSCETTTEQYSLGTQSNYQDEKETQERYHEQDLLEQTDTITTTNKKIRSITSKRLFDAKEQQRKIKEREVEKLRNQLKDCTFTPKINARSTDRRKNLIGDRLFKKGEEQRRSREKETLKAMEKQRSVYTFKPKINPSSKRKVKSQGDIVNRLLGESKAEKLKRLDEMKEKNQMRECTFAPDLSKSSSKKLPKKREDVWDRLSQGNQKKTIPSLSIECTFQPKVSSISSATMSIDSSDREKVWDRLSRDSSFRMDKKEEWEKKKVEKELSECTFDARKTVQKLRKEQKARQQFLQRQHLEIDVSNKGVVAAPKSSAEVGPSCFQTALNIVTAGLINNSPRKQIKNVSDNEDFEENAVESAKKEIV